MELNRASSLYLLFIKKEKSRASNRFDALSQFDYSTSDTIRVSSSDTSIHVSLSDLYL